MRLVLVVGVLALVAASPARGSADEGTGGLPVPRGATGGTVVPGQSESPSAVAGGAGPAGETRPAGSIGPTASGAAETARDRPADLRARAAQQDEPPPAGTEPEQPRDPEMEVQVPIDEPERRPAESEPTPSAAPFGGLPATGVAVAAFALLGAAAALAGIGIRRAAS